MSVNQTCRTVITTLYSDSLAGESPTKTKYSLTYIRKYLLDEVPTEFSFVFIFCGKLCIRLPLYTITRVERLLSEQGDKALKYFVRIAIHPELDEFVDMFLEYTKQIHIPNGFAEKLKDREYLRSVVKNSLDCVKIYNLPKTQKEVSLYGKGTNNQIIGLG